MKKSNGEELVLDLTIRKRGSIKNNIAKCPKCGKFGKKETGDNFQHYIHKYYKNFGLTRIEACYIKGK